MIIAAAGSRWDEPEPEEVAAFDGYLREVRATYVRLGECRGIDTDLLGYLLALGWRVQVWHAPWDKHPRAGGPIRNREMMRGEPIEVVKVEHHGAGWGEVEQLDGRISTLVHWPGTNGTASARAEATAAGAELISIVEFVARVEGSYRGSAG